MYLLDTSIEINAAPQKVWDIITDFGSYGQWNPLSPAAEGKLEQGAVLKITIVPAGGKPMAAKCTLTALEPGRKIAWMGKAPIPGMMSGEHALEVEALPDGRTRFRNSEVMRGWLFPLMRGSYERGFKPQFHAMNEALKKRAEAG